MKRFGLFLLVLISVLCLATCGAAEGVSTPTDVECEHINNNMVAVGDATTHWYVCADCGEITSEATTHFTTCQEEIGHCHVCDVEYDYIGMGQSILHNGDENYLYNETQCWRECLQCGEPFDYLDHFRYSCETTGCLRCGKEDVEAFNHTWGEPVIVAATCTTDGSKTTICTACGEETVEIIPAGHQIGYTYDDTMHYLGCKNCDYLFDSFWHYDHCDNQGVCFECGATDVTFDFTGHELLEENVKYNQDKHWWICGRCEQEVNHIEHFAKCTEPEVCDSCGATAVNVIIGHSNWTMEGNAEKHWESCADCGLYEEGKHIDLCSNPDGKCEMCGEACGEEAQNHLWKETSNTEVTCLTDGVKKYTCELCKKTKDEITKAIGKHTWGEPVIVAATCTTDGSKTTVCTACGEKIVETIKAVGHTEETIPGKAATCTETGLSDGKICSVCDEVIAEQNSIPAKGHNRVKDEGVEPTADTDGLTEGYHCSRCGAVLVKQEIIPAVGSASVPMTELEIFLDQMLEENEHDNRGDNVPKNGKDFEIPLTKSNKEDNGIVLHVYRENNETYNAVGLSVSFKEDVTEEISSMQDQVTSISELKNEEKIAGFVEYVRSLVVTLSPEQLEADATDELVLEILKNITITDEDFGDLIEAFVDGKLDIDRRTVIRDGYEYFLVSDGKTLSLSVRKIEK